MKESEWIYVGDGVYARSDGYQMVVKTDGDPIYLDNQVWFSLSRLRDAWMKEDEPEGDDESSCLVGR